VDREIRGGEEALDAEEPPPPRECVLRDRERASACERGREREGGREGGRESVRASHHVNESWFKIVFILLLVL
jgi:hypothetical protein